MNSLPAFAIPAAIALVLVSAAVAAQDKPNTTTANQANTRVTAPSKATKANAKAPTPLNSTNTKTLGELSGAKQSTPAANPIAPAMERARESCHDKDSDA